MPRPVWTRSPSRAGTVVRGRHRPGDLEERTWLAFLIAVIGPAEDGEPFAEIERVRVPWAGGAIPDLSGVTGGARTSLAPGDPPAPWRLPGLGGAVRLPGHGDRRGRRVDAAAALCPGLRAPGLPGLQRGARYDLLATLGAAGLYELQAGTLALGAGDPVTVAAKRVFGIGDAILLERRAAGLAEACGVALQALDVALFNWERGERAALGVGDTEPDAALAGAAASALGL